MKLCMYSVMLLSCLLIKYLDLGRLLTFSLESEKVGFVLPAKSVGGLFPFRYNNAELVCCYCITQLTTSSPRKTIELSFLIKVTSDPGRH